MNMQTPQPISYQGYVILPKPEAAGSDDIWYGGYELLKDGKLIRSRTHIFPAFLYFDAARGDSIEHAKLEIENLIAVSPHSQ